MIYLGDETGLGNKKIPFEVKRRNFFIVGSSKSGKTERLAGLALDDIYNGKKVIAVGRGLIKRILPYIPNNKQADTVYFDPTLQRFGFNSFANVPPERHLAVVDSVIDTILSRLSYDSSSPRIDHFVRMCVTLALNMDDGSPLSIEYLLTDPEYRNKNIWKLKDLFIRKHWIDFEKLNAKDQFNVTESTLTKLSVFMSNPLLRNCLVQSKNFLNFENDITLVSLDEQKLGEDGASFLGALVLGSVQASGVTDTTLYIDDASAYGSRLIGKLLRNSRLTTILSVHSMDEFPRLNDVLKSAEIMALRTTVVDEDILTKAMRVKPGQVQLSSLPDYEAYVRRGELAVGLDLPLHGYVVPPKTRTRSGGGSRKSVEERIIDRCARQCTLSENKVKRLLRDFSNG